jgi:LysM repeat protein
MALVAGLVAAACAPTAQSAAPATPRLLPYHTITPSATAETTADFVISAETPLPSATPSTYTIKTGDTLSQIAERLRVSVDSLLLANPGLDPNALRVGEELLFPGGGSDAAPATATPAPLQIVEVGCRPMATGAAWCFALIHNDSTDALENITGLISVLDSAGTALDSRDVALLLDILPPGASLPLAVPFQGPLSLDVHSQVRILTAMRIPADTPRYLPASVQNTVTRVSWSGRTAAVNGELILPAGSADASEVWLAAVAYDASGQLVGWRRWESPTGTNAGTTLPFRFFVYSLAGAIDRVELVIQARP